MNRSPIPSQQRQLAQPHNGGVQRIEETRSDLIEFILLKRAYRDVKHALSKLRDGGAALRKLDDFESTGNDEILNELEKTVSAAVEKGDLKPEEHPAIRILFRLKPTRAQSPVRSQGSQVPPQTPVLQQAGRENNERLPLTPAPVPQRTKRNRPAAPMEPSVDIDEQSKPSKDKDINHDCKVDVVHVQKKKKKRLTEGERLLKSTESFDGTKWKPKSLDGKRV